jgi:hypothetical protein
MSDKRFGNALMAWHASPFDIPEGKFGAMSEVSGKGQGAASFGRGAAYVAESPAVSGPGTSSYMEEFSKHPAVVGNRGAPNLRFNGVNLQELHKAKTQDYDRYLKLLDLSSLNRSPHLLDNLHEFINVYNEAHSDTLYEAPQNLTEGFGAFLRYKIEGEHYTDQNSRPEDIEARDKFLREDSAELWSKVLQYTTPYVSNESEGPYSYRVAVHLTPETMLDWDNSLVDHHPEAMEKILKAFSDPAAAEEWRDAPQSGETVYKQLVRNNRSDFAASEALYNAGIHGIRYEDGSSRHSRPELLLDSSPWVNMEEGDERKNVVALAQFVERHGGDIDKAIEGVRRSAAGYRKMRDTFYADKDDALIKWATENRNRLSVKREKKTYNYVIFHPDFIKALAQYDIKGDKIKDYGPGVHLKSVEHDPFKGE